MTWAIFLGAAAVIAVVSALVGLPAIAAWIDRSTD
jgi:hypothetical protein